MIIVSDESCYVVCYAVISTTSSSVPEDVVVCLEVGMLCNFCSDSK